MGIIARSNHVTYDIQIGEDKIPFTEQSDGTYTSPTLSDHHQQVLSSHGAFTLEEDGLSDIRAIEVLRERHAAYTVANPPKQEKSEDKPEFIEKKKNRDTQFNLGSRLRRRKQ